MAEIDSNIIVKFLHFATDYEGDVAIECNFCSTDDYVFAEHEQLKSDHDWLAMAYQHVTVHHEKMLKETLAKTT